MDIQKNIDILNEDIEKLSQEKINNSIAQMLSAYYGAKIALESILNKNGKTTTDIEKTTPQIENKTFINELDNAFPTYNKYLQEHSEHNLKKLCLEIKEFCVSVYSTLQSEEEKKIYFDMLKSLTLF